jgi:hypothetical protein
MKMLGRVFLLLMLVSLTAVPAMAQEGATTYTNTFEGDFYLEPVDGWFLCFTDTPWEQYETHYGPGHYHGVYHVTTTPSGTYTMHYTEHMQGDTVGYDTGDEYRTNYTINEHLNGRIGETYHWVWPLSMKNVTKNRLQIHDIHVHITVNANGEVVVEREEIGVRCAGPDH